MIKIDRIENGKDNNFINQDRTKIVLEKLKKMDKFKSNVKTKEAPKKEKKSEEKIVLSILNDEAKKWVEFFNKLGDQNE